MSVKKQVIQESIERISIRLQEIKELLSANPLSRICEIRIEAQKLLETYKSVKERTSDEFINKISKLADQEKKQFKIAKKQQESIILIDEQVELEHELQELMREKYYIDRKESKTAEC